MDDHINIYICTRPADARPDLQTHGRTHRRADGHAEAQTDTQTGGRTRRSTDADAGARTGTQGHGRGRRSTDADASARWRTDAKYLCVQCVGGKIVQTRPASGRTHKDLRGVLYMHIVLRGSISVHIYIYIYIYARRTEREYCHAYVYAHRGERVKSHHWPWQRLLALWVQF